MTPSLEVTSLSARLHRIRIAGPGAAPRASALLDERDTSPDRETAGLSVIRENQGLVLGDAAGRPLLRFTVAAGPRLGATFEVVGEQHFYGLGQGGAGFDRLGTTRRLWNVHVNHGQGGDIAIPLLLSNRGYALFFDTTSEALLDPGDCNDATLFRFSCDDAALDIYFLGGGSLRETMNDVAALLGRAPMPPRWSLGFLQSTRHFELPAELPAMARELRRRELPCAAIILLSSYGEALGWNRGVGHLDYAPGMRESIAELRALGIRVVLHEYPVLHADSPLAAEARMRGFLHEAAYARRPPGPVNYEQGQHYIDFSHDGAGEWWWRQHAHLEADGWWLDGGEGPPSGTLPPVHNGYDGLRQRVFARADRRNFLLCRSGGPGMQRFGAACWSGDVNNDFATFEAQIAIGLNVGLSGVPYWGTDIGGYYPAAPRDPELFARWFQFGAFCGVFRAHGRSWREHLPYGHGDEVDAICRRYLALRTALMPYTYTLAWQAHAQGLPLMRPLVLNYPDDPRIWALGQQFLWGDDILVAPVTRGGARHWPVYLPAGVWHDYWTQARYVGPVHVEVQAPLDRLPLFIRDGAIIPMASGDALSLLHYPSGRSSFALYDDDGQSTAYRDGRHTLTAIASEASRDAILIEIGPPMRRVELRVRLPARPSAVDAADWHYDAAGFVVIRNVAAPGRVTIAPQGEHA